MVTTVIEGAVAAVDMGAVVSGGSVPGTKAVVEEVSEVVRASVSLSAGDVVTASVSGGAVSLTEEVSELGDRSTFEMIGSEVIDVIDEASEAAEVLCSVKVVNGRASVSEMMSVS